MVKDEYLIAVPQKEADKQSTDDRKPLDAAKSQPKNQQFKSFAWTQPITLLGDYLIIHLISVFRFYLTFLARFGLSLG